MLTVLRVILQAPEATSGRKKNMYDRNIKLSQVIYEVLFIALLLQALDAEKTRKGCVTTPSIMWPVVLNYFRSVFKSNAENSSKIWRVHENNMAALLVIVKE